VTRVFSRGGVVYCSFSRWHTSTEKIVEGCRQGNLIHPPELWQSYEISYLTANHKNRRREMMTFALRRISFILRRDL
jgi:hypothetical protein